MGSVLRGVILAWLAVGMAAGQIVLSPAPGGGGGGGAPTDATYWVGSTNGSLSAEIVVNGIASLEAAIGAYDFNDAANLTTGDIAAARMATNWGTAGTSACAETGGVLVDDASTIGCSAGLTYASNKLTVGTAAGAAIGLNRYSVNDRFYMTAGPSLVFDIGSGFWWMDGSSTDSAFWLGNPSGAAGIKRSTDALQLYGDSKVLMTLGGTQTALFQDPTATTGVTSVIVKGGAGQSTNPVFTVQNNSGTANATILESGAATVASVTMAATGATFYGASANEPVSCSASIDGSIYFDTTDQKLCICANDGTDDEWLMSDDYSHLTGHCSL